MTLLSFTVTGFYLCSLCYNDRSSGIHLFSQDRKRYNQTVVFILFSVATPPSLCWISTLSIQVPSERFLYLNICKFNCIHWRYEFEFTPTEKQVWMWAFYRPWKNLLSQDILENKFTASSSLCASQESSN